jgi:hypothetical protein
VNNQPTAAKACLDGLHQAIGVLVADGYHLILNPGNQRLLWRQF